MRRRLRRPWNGGMAGTGKWALYLVRHVAQLWEARDILEKKRGAVKKENPTIFATCKGCHEFGELGAREVSGPRSQGPRVGAARAPREAGGQL